MAETSEWASDTPALFSPEMLHDPNAAYRRLRETEPVYWHEPMQAWILTRFDDVEAALRDTRLSSAWSDVSLRAGDTIVASAASDWQLLRDLLAFVQNSLVFSDPPRHTRLRTLIGKAFLPAMVEAQRSAVQRLTDGLLNAVQARGEMDLVRDLAYPLPIAVIAHMLGIAIEDRDQLKRWCDDLLLPFGRDPATLSEQERLQASQGGAALSAYVRDLIRDARSRPRDDLLSALTQATEGGEQLTEDELTASVILFLIAGHENLTSLIGNGMLALLQHPDQLLRLRRDPSLLPHAVEDLLRYVSPNQFIRRRATTDLTIADKTVRAGEFAVLVLAAANRDPEHFADPDRLDCSRAPSKHLALGEGPHYCTGAPLTRLEAEIVLSTLLQRFPKLQLASDAWTYQNNFNVRLLTSLPVRFS